MEHITREEAYDLLKSTQQRSFSYPACTDCGSCDEMVCRAAWLGIRQTAHNDFGSNESYGR